MPKRNDIKSILIIGAGPIIIGQACEFDYSGAQACKALREEGYRVILVNSNPATIMTDPELADATYIEPVTPEIVAKIIEKERPDALLPTMGGQTALNTALSLKRMGVLERYNVEMIGANAQAIDKAEDRALFREAMQKIGLDTPRSMLANATEIKEQDRAFYEAKKTELKTLLKGAEQHNALEALEQEWRSNETKRKKSYMAYAIAKASEALEVIGLPAIIRPSFTLGGTGGGIAYNRSDFFEIIESGLEASPTTEILIEESVLGWKEYEMEVVRDSKDNCIIVCSIENIDPMGIHTGDSITVAPAMTLTDKEYQRMRNASIAVLREIGVETGGSNVQFAVNPENGKLIVIEMNPRVSRSSALASKATGFPIAKIAAKLAIGYTLDELKNDITGGATPASFEPSIDYIVTKIPRFTFEKFPGASNTLGTSMKSVGEVMAIGRSFAESLQKALCGLETKLSGFDDIALPPHEAGEEKNIILAEIAKITPDRLRYIAQAIRMQISLEEIYQITKIDPWFLKQIEQIIHTEQRIIKYGLPQNAELLLELKAMGFSDQRLATLSNNSMAYIKDLRNKAGIHPVFKRIDSCAGEFNSSTAYMYSTYEAKFLGHFQSEANISTRKKVVILGGGPNRIGQGIEFDYCCCHAAFALREMDIEAIMINCNPETVSTDYDTSDRLYFEPLTIEHVLNILELEKQKGELLGVIVQFGGQTPLNLAKAIEAAGIPIIGTQPQAIDLAEDRDQFQKLLSRLKLTQPKNGISWSVKEAYALPKTLGFPVIVRPSYVLGGRAMQVLHSEKELQHYIDNTLIALIPEEIKNKFKNNLYRQIDGLLSTNPLLFDSYLTDATELDVDCLADGKDCCIVGIMQHIEEAGIHSGDSACSLPPYNLAKDVIARVTEHAKSLAKSLNIIGFMNIQFAIKDDVIYILEVNPRASRTVPFVAKAIGVPLAKIATRIMVGKNIEQAMSAYGKKNENFKQNHIAVKEAVFPFARFTNTDTLLGPEMRSTGEVMGIDYSFPLAFAKAQIAAGAKLPKEGTIFVSVANKDKQSILPAIRTLADCGFNIIATTGTQKYLEENGIVAKKINKVFEGHPHIEDAIRNYQVDLMFNTTKSASSISDSKSLRRAALLQKIPYYTTIEGANAASQAIIALKENELTVRPLQDYFKQTTA